MDYVSLGCCALALVVYLNTLNAGFVYDDRRAILGNPDVMDATQPWFQLLFNDFWGTPLVDSGSHGSYRPLCVLSFKLNHIIGGFKPFGYHLVNVLLHCLATGLVVKLARHIIPYGFGTLIAGLLFATHPIHTEAVASIVGRADLIACNFYILTVLTYIRHVQWREKFDLRHWLALAIAVLCALFAMLCKETAISALFVCVFYDILKGLNKFSKDRYQLRSIGILGVAIATILHFRLSLPGTSAQFSTADNPTAKSSILLTRFYTFFYLPVFNFKLLVYPNTLSFDWGMDAIPRITSFFDTRNVVSLMFYSIMCRLVIKCLFNLRRSSIPKMSTSKRFGRTIQKRKLQKALDDGDGVASLTMDSETNCSVCKHGSKYQLTTVTRPVCGGKKHPLEKYIRNNYTSQLNNENSMLDSNNNNEACIDENNNNEPTHNKPPLPVSTINRNLTQQKNSRNFSVKFVSNQLLKHIKSTELSSKQTKLNSSSATLLSIALLTLPFLPASNLFFYVGFVVAERILYLPSVGYCLLIGLGLGKIINFKTPSGRVKSRQRTEGLHHQNTKSLATIVILIVVISLCSLKSVWRNLDWRDEESLYRSAIGVNPPKALGNLGSVLSSQGRFKEAEDILIRALKHRSNMADVHYNLGILYQNQQNFEDAVSCFQKAIHFRPTLALAYLNLGTSLIALRRCHEAASVLRDGTKIDGTGLRDRNAHENARVSSLLQLGSLYVDQGKLQRALAVYREALSRLPQNYPPQEIYHRLSDVFMRLKKWSEAEKFQKYLLEFEPNHIGAHISYGTMLARNTSRLAEAEKVFKKAIRLAPLDSAVYHHYAEFLTSIGRYEEACIARMRATELSPNDYQLVTAAATALRILDRKDEAEKWYRQAVNLRPYDARAHTNLGAILHLLGQTHQATKSYKKALNLQPDDPTTLANLKKLEDIEL